jgi:hypothetical protein
MALSYPLATGFFKTKDDGSRVFFPWGFWGRGHIIPSDKDFERLHEQMSALLGALLMLMVVIVCMIVNFADGWDKLYYSAVVMLPCITAFAIWAGVQSRRLVSTDEELSLDEWAANAAHKHSRLNLWLNVIVYIGWFVAPIFATAWRPDSGLGMIVMGYYGVFLSVAHALILRAKKQQESQPAQS